MKKLTLDNLKTVPRRDAHPDHRRAARGEPVPARRTTTPASDDEAIQYLHERRRELGGYLPERRSKHTAITLPDDSAYAIAKKGSGKQEIATTMAFARLLKDLLRAKDFGNRIVPIIPDEARTFGMDAYFPNAKIYNPNGQHYTSVDRELLLAYKESPQGQIVHVGINEAGALRGVHRRRHVVRDAGRAAHPGLRLLLDVRLPAHGRRDVGGGRPDGARLHHRRDRRTHHAHRRGPAARRRPLAAARVDEPGRRRRTTPPTATRSGTSCAPASTACTAATTPTRTSCTTSRSTTSRSCSPPSPRASTSTASSRGIYQLSRSRRCRARRRSCSPPASPCRGRSRRRSCSPRTGACRPTSGASRRGPSCAATASPPTSTTSSTPMPSAARAVRHAEARRAPTVRSSRSPTSCTPCPTRSAQFVPGDYATLGADGFGFSDTRAAARRFFKIDGPSVVVRTLQLLADRGEVDRVAPGPGDREVPAARRERRHHRIGRRRELAGDEVATKPQDEGADARLAAHHLGRAVDRDAEAPRGHAALVRRHAPGPAVAPSASSPRPASRSFISWFDDPQVDARGSPPTSSAPRRASCCAR